MPLEFIGCKISKEWLEQLDEIARSSGSTRSDIVKQAIGQFLGESSQAKQDGLTALTIRLERLEKIVSQLESLPNKRLNVVNQTDRLEGSEKISNKGTNAQPDSQTLTRDDSQRGEPPLCLKCGSAHTRFEGRGKKRKDGSRSQRIFCLDCRKISSIG